MELCRIRYPCALSRGDRPQLFIGDGSHARGALIRFRTGHSRGDGCVVRFNGLFSHTTGPLLCYADGDPQVPGNRFIDVGFGTEGDELPSGALACGLTVCERIQGSAADPYVELRARGRFAPAGSGAVEYSFGVYLSTHGSVHLGEIDTRTSGLSISQADNHIEVTLPR